MGLSEKEYWIGFNLVKGIGSVRFQNLIRFFGSLEIAWQAPLNALAEAGLSQRIAENILHLRRTVDLHQVLYTIESQGIQVITWEDDQYPPRLKEIDQPPPVLYVRGSLTSEDQWAVAIVGTRRVTAYGRKLADELATYLVHNGITVVSGLARGTDGVAHEAALKAGGRTIAVLGCGVDVIYPPEHARLADNIIKHGALVSDYPIGSPPESSNFPPRNRIISGMSLATVVIEAGEKSGALITATFAAEQGREVLAVPGGIYSPLSKGTNRLISQGARPMLSVEDVLDSLHLERTQEHRQAQLLFPADEVESAILTVLGDDAVQMDEIGIQSGLAIEKISAALALMELKGMVNHLGGMQYSAVRESPAGYDINGDAA